MPITVRCREEGYDCRTERYCPREIAASTSKKKTVDKAKLTAAMKEIDLYRAKYRHADLTPYAWCFHGDKAQGWHGQAVNHRLVVKDYTKKIGDINANLYKYISFNVEIPSFWLVEKLTPVGTTTVPCSDIIDPPYFVKPITCLDRIYYPSLPSPTGGYQAYTDSITSGIDTSQLNDLRMATSSAAVQYGATTATKCAACNIGEYSDIANDFIVVPGESADPYPKTGYTLPVSYTRYRKDLYESALPAGYSYEMTIRYFKQTTTTETPPEGGTVTRVATTAYTKTVDLHDRSNFRVVDMTGETDWSDTIKKIEITFVIKYNGVTQTYAVNGKTVHPIAYLEYFKVDKVNLAAEVSDDYNVPSIDINSLRTAVDTLNKSAIDWSKKGTTDDRVKDFLSLVKRKDFDDLITVTRSLAPYNGCSTCDTFTCQCYAISDGYVACTPCNACNAFQACQNCDKTCYTQARTTCSCNQVCYTQARACTCYATCYQYRAACTCNGAHD